MPVFSLPLHRIKLVTLESNANDWMDFVCGLVWAIEKQRSRCVTQKAGDGEETFEKIRGEGI